MHITLEKLIEVASERSREKFDLDSQRYWLAAVTASQLTGEEHTMDDFECFMSSDTTLDADYAEYTRLVLSGKALYLEVILLGYVIRRDLQALLDGKSVEEVAADRVRKQCRKFKRNK